MNDADPIVQMMQDLSGLWDVTDERVELIRSNFDKLSYDDQRIASEMLDIAEHQRVWSCKAEYYAVLVAIQRIGVAPNREEVLGAIKLITESSQRDRVGHREWVTDTVTLLRRIADGM